MNDFDLKETNKIVLSEIYNKYLNELEYLERDRFFCRHNYEHFISVARICYILKLEEDVDVSKDMVYSTGLLHDLGRVTEIKEGINHAIASVPIAREILELTDFTEDEKNRILECISYHRTKEPSEDEFFNIFYRADKLSRACFRCPAYDECNWSYEKKNHFIKY
ncbi:HD domain-containing protein [Peptoniphilus sp. MSJ-1]|uniref:HD domain-containing protein n=1 Tax=Peptoniphilus ovalis TaxID=2841503 RepID=A0ABS6FG41_9FIRM|nr:HD domain-containing protein [Peptoniphilus ovalis]